MPAARELRVGVADEPGTLGSISELLGQSGVNIEGFGVWVSIAHLLVSDVDRAIEILDGHGFRYQVADVLRLVVPDEAGNLAEIARALGEAGINIDYAYSVSEPTPGAAAFVLAVANADQASQLLE